MEDVRNSIFDKNEPLRVAVIGDAGAGKSTFINCLHCQNVAKTGDSEMVEGVTKNIEEYKGKIFGTS